MMNTFSIRVGKIQEFLEIADFVATFTEKMDAKFHRRKFIRNLSIIAHTTELIKNEHLSHTHEIEKRAILLENPFTIISFRMQQYIHTFSLTHFALMGA